MWPTPMPGSAEVGDGLLGGAVVLADQRSRSLPSRDTWLLELSMILGDLEQGIPLNWVRGIFCRHAAEAAGWTFQIATDL